jgi:hypothetical protein
MEISRNWRLKNQRYNLEGTVCECGHKNFPPRKICPQCKENPQHPVNFTGTGEVYSYATVYEAPEGFDTIGMKVEMVTRKLREKGDSGLIIYGYKFRPLLQW